MVEPTNLCSSLSYEFNYCSGDVIVNLERYESHNNQTLRNDCLMKMGEQCAVSFINTVFDEQERCGHTMKKRKICLGTSKNDLREIKNSYDTYIPQVISQTVDGNRRASKNSPCHSHIINLLEHAMDGNDALLFRMRMKTLKQTCALTKACVKEEASELSEDTLDTNVSTKACVKEEASELSEDTLDTNVSYPREAPKFIHPSIREKCNGCFILKTPLWAIQYGLSCSYQSKKKYSIEVSNALELE